MATPEETSPEAAWANIGPDDVPLRKILVATALLEKSVTVAFAHKLSKVGETEISLLHVVETPRAELLSSAFAATTNWQTNLDLRQQRALTKLETYCETFAKRGIKCRASVRVGIAHEQILDEADVNTPDLLIIGNRATSILSKFLIGTTAEKVVRHATCAVLISHRQPAR